MTILRIYDPPECDANGVPLDWECCRTCGGSGEAKEVLTPTIDPRDPAFEVKDWPECPTCDSWGSLKDAALAVLHEARLISQRRMGVARGDSDPAPDPTICCESCSHPMSEGTWEGVLPRSGAVLRSLQEGIDPAMGDRDDLPTLATHFSPCDEGCRHGGPGRYMEPRRTGEARIWKNWQTSDRTGPGRITDPILGNTVEASWRQVDVRCLGWLHDLRPEKLSVLCLRCLAKRSA